MNYPLLGYLSEIYPKNGVVIGIKKIMDIALLAIEVSNPNL